MTPLHIKDVPALSRADQDHLVFHPANDAPGTVTRYTLFFPRIDAEGKEDEGSGFSFDCDATGFVDLGRLSECAVANLAALLKIGEVEGRKYGAGRIIIRQEIKWRDRPQMICRCGRSTLELALFTNTCSFCHADYNTSGALLAPRSQWGADTGESVQDILNVDNEGGSDE